MSDGGFRRISGVIRTGPWRRVLLAVQHPYRVSGARSYDPVIVYRPDGEAMLTVARSQDNADYAVARWLDAKGRVAS